MAGRDHNYTRRAVLGAAFAVPALAGAGPSSASIALRAVPASASTPTLPSPIEGEGTSRRWNRALAAFRRAEAALDAVARETSGLVGVGPEQDASEERFGDCLCAFYAAMRRLLRAPAPDLDALALKIALIVDYEVATLTGGERCLAVLKADARRLV
ncbi:MAG TPA: hypothetical protein VEW71_06950 [Allosphingosinicella sp.]|nr:hypothetical protein [Allosphingosinicella sp.]